MTYPGTVHRSHKQTVARIRLQPLLHRLDVQTAGVSHICTGREIDFTHNTELTKYASFQLIILLGHNVAAPTQRRRCHCVMATQQYASGGTIW